MTLLLQMLGRLFGLSFSALLATPHDLLHWWYVTPIVYAFPSKG